MAGFTNSRAQTRRGNRIARQADAAASSPKPPEDQRLAGPHGDLPEIQRETFRRRAPSAPDRASPTDAPPRVTSRSASLRVPPSPATASIVSGRMPRSRGLRRPIVRSAPARPYSRTRRRCRPACAVRPARQFIAGGGKGDARPPPHRQPAPDRPPPAAPDRARSEPGPLCASTSPAAKSRPAARMKRPRVAALRRMRHVSPSRIGIFLDDDGVGAVRHHAAGENAHRFARADACRQRDGRPARCRSRRRGPLVAARARHSRPSPRRRMRRLRHARRATSSARRAAQRVFQRRRRFGGASGRKGGRRCALRASSTLSTEHARCGEII